MMEQGIALSGIATLTLSGLAASNFMYDRGVPNTVSRYAAPVIGGTAFLVAVLWLEVWIAVSLSALMTLNMLVFRTQFRRGLRGVEGTLLTQAWAEVTYPMAGTVSLAVGWGLLGDRWLAFLPIAFMAWGDSTAGLLRATIWHKKRASLWPSVAMFGVCLVAAVFYHSYWIGIAGALVATVAERRRPMVLTLWDDNLHLVAVALLVMVVLVKVSA